MEYRNANCNVLGCGESAEHHSHVKQVTPMQTKKAEMLSAKEAGLDPVREKSVTAARRENNVRPLDGGIAK